MWAAVSTNRGSRRNSVPRGRSAGTRTTSMARHPTHVYDEPGTYTVTLTGFATNGASASESKNVTVVAP